MEFLPIRKDGSKVYAGFWRRLGAMLVDGFVFVPILAISDLLVSKSISSSAVHTVISEFSFSAYTIYFHYRHGATLGKMATDIKVTLPDGSPIGIKEAFLRSYVDLGFSIVVMFAELSAMGNADAEQLWSAWLGTVAMIWLWSEVVVLLSNERKRAFHDFIAGTVVIHRKYAK